MGEVKKTWIVRRGAALIVLFQTVEGNFYIMSHVIGQVTPISQQEGAMLIGM